MFLLVTLLVFMWSLRFSGLVEDASVGSGSVLRTTSRLIISNHSKQEVLLS